MCSKSSSRKLVMWPAALQQGSRTYLGSGSRHTLTPSPAASRMGRTALKHFFRTPSGAICRQPDIWHRPGFVWKAGTGIPISSDPIRTVLEKMSRISVSLLVSSSSSSLATMLATQALARSERGVTGKIPGHLARVEWPFCLRGTHPRGPACATHARALEGTCCALGLVFH